MQQKSKPSRVGGIDGLRALSIIAILIYHLNLPWLPSGHMGVVVFLVLSGYFATITLVRSLNKDTRPFPMKLAVIWGRRLLRIVPSVVALVAIVGTLCAVFNHVLLTKMRPDVLPSLAFFLNWSYIIRDVSYFDMIGGTSPLLHLWYIGVDLQFFLAWTLALAILLKRGERFARVCTLLLTIASAVCMALLYVPQADPSRVYYGTDTRAFSLLLGSWLALAFPLGKKPEVLGQLFVKPVSRNGRHTDGRVRATVSSQLLGIIAFGGIVASMALIPADSTLWYRGGMLVLSLVATFFVATMLVPGSILAAILGIAPLRALGRRSFALYLWHYPIFLLMSAQMSTTVWYLRLAAVGVALVAAELSMRLVEQSYPSLLTSHAPQQNDSVSEEKSPKKRKKKSKSETRKERRRQRARELELAKRQQELKRRRICAAVSTLIVAGTGAFTYHALATTADASLVPEESLVSTGVAADQAIDVSARKQQIEKEGTSTPKNDSTSSSSSNANATEEAKTETAAKKKAEAEAQKKAQEEAAKPKAVTVTTSTILHAPESERSKGLVDPLLIGDSVPGDAGDDLVPNGAGWDTRLPDALIDTFIGRSPYQSLEVLRGYMNQNVIGKIIVMACFSNSTPSIDTLNAMVEAAGSERQIFLVGTVNPDGFQEEANANLQDTANRFANVHYVDWPAVLEGHLKEYLWADATHLRPEGAAVYVQMVVNAIAQEMVNAGGTTSEG